MDNTNDFDKAWQLQVACLEKCREHGEKIAYLGFALKGRGTTVGSALAAAKAIVVMGYELQEAINRVPLSMIDTETIFKESTATVDAMVERGRGGLAMEVSDKSYRAFKPLKPPMG